MTLEIIQGLLLAFALVVILMPPYIRFLRHLGFGKRIRVEGPEGHMVKEGTPTTGGLLVILVVLGLYVLLHGVPERGIIAPLAALGIVGFLGAVDDYLNAKTGEGIRARQKLIWQTVFGVFFAWQIQQTYGLSGFRVPVLGDVDVDPWVWVALAAFGIVATSNGVNITDGLDGLAGGTLVFSFVAFLIIAILNIVPQPDGSSSNQPQVAVLCALLIGGLLGFLWFNVHPAQIFMGDSGSLSFGATLAVIAIITGQLFVLPLIGLIFVVETGSVILQVAYFKATGGRRLFRMSPIHHHFELGGWDEEKITLRFWIVAVLAGLLGVTLFLASLSDFQLTA
jgi:phospho-N-acetylmuramoyl-pentapeptide-transferase